MDLEKQALDKVYMLNIIGSKRSKKGTNVSNPSRSKEELRNVIKNLEDRQAAIESNIITLRSQAHVLYKKKDTRKAINYIKRVKQEESRAVAISKKIECVRTALNNIEDIELDKQVMQSMHGALSSVNGMEDREEEINQIEEIAEDIQENMHGLKQVNDTMKNMLYSNDVNNDDEDDSGGVSESDKKMLDNFMRELDEDKDKDHLQHAVGDDEGNPRTDEEMEDLVGISPPTQIRQPYKQSNSSNKNEVQQEKFTNQNIQKQQQNYKTKTKAKKNKGANRLIAEMTE